MAARFTEGHIDEEKVFNGKVFPLTLCPSNASECSSNDLVEKVKAEAEGLSKTLKEYGAILFRGFDVSSAEEYSDVVKAFGWDEFSYVGPADRTKLADRVYTANAVPFDVNIPFHHEMAQIRKYPSKIFFFCLKAPPEGGQTSILPSDIYVEKLGEKIPQVKERLEKEGVIINLRTGHSYKSKDGTDSTVGVQLWQQMLRTDDEKEAEKRAMEMLSIDYVKFNSDGSADFTSGPLNPIREFEGKKIIFNNIVPYKTKERDISVSFGDGTPLSSYVIDTINEIFEEIRVDVRWRKGDVLLVDNLTVQHARRPGKPPRVVLVSLSN